MSISYLVTQLERHFNYEVPREHIETSLEQIIPDRWEGTYEKNGVEVEQLIYISYFNPEESKEGIYITLCTIERKNKSSNIREKYIPFVFCDFLI